MAIILDISFGIDGLWTIQDNGNPADGISEVRDPNGALFTTFLHPGDSVTLISRAGQNLTVNLTESLGTASFTVGSLTSTMTRPDTIFVGQVSSSSIVTLTANQAIVELGGDAATDIIAGTLLLDAGTGIGTGGNPIETQVAQLEGESVTGGIALSNIGDVIVGGATAELRGLFTGTSGNIALTNQGSITLADTTNIQTIASAGNIALIAIGAATDITSIVNQDALFATGDLNLSAGRDILFGTGGANFDNDVRAGGGIFVTAGNDFHIDGNADMLANDAGTASNGGIQILVGGDILIEDSTGTSASVGVSTGAGGILLATGAGGTLSLGANSASAVFAGSGGVTVSADRVLIESDSGITTTGSGAIVITGASTSRNIILGSVTDAAAAVELSDAELDRLFTQNAIIGNQFTGQVAVQAAITHPNANLTLQSQSDILIQASISAVTSLTLRAGDTVTQSGGTTISTGALNIFVDTPDLDAPGGQSFFAGTVSVTSSTITGNADADTLIGTGDDDALVGAAGDDALDGRSGADQMIGGLGNDTYVVDNVGDIVTEAAAAGTDTVQSSITYTLGANAREPDPDRRRHHQRHRQWPEQHDHRQCPRQHPHRPWRPRHARRRPRRRHPGRRPRQRHLRRRQWQRHGDRGGRRRDRHRAELDQLHARRQSREFDPDRLGQRQRHRQRRRQHPARQCRQQHRSTAGRRRHDERRRSATTPMSSTMSATPPARRVGGGTDLVQSSVTFILASNIENLTLTGLNAVNGTGNNLANSLTGNNAANILDGGFGADTMQGGLGNDTYVIDNAGDVVTESAGAGTDTVQSSLNHTLGANFERLVLTGTGNTTGTGNGLANIITGNSGANAIDGGAGGDIMIGGGGNDSYFVDNGLDQVTELAGGGIDTINASLSHDLEDEVENLILTGAAAINGAGNSLANTISGNGAANVLNGDLGADTLNGGLGDDTYVVDNAGDIVSETRRPGHRQGAELDQLHAGGGSREFDPDRDRRDQRHRQSVRQHAHRQ